MEKRFFTQTLLMYYGNSNLRPLIYKSKSFSIKLDLVDSSFIVYFEFVKQISL